MWYTYGQWYIILFWKYVNLTKGQPLYAYKSFFFLIIHRMNWLRNVSVCT